VKALPDFVTTLIGAPDIPFPLDLDKRVSGNMDFFFRHEYKAFAQYIPNVKRIKENNVDMITAVGRDNDDSQCVQATRALTSRLRCKCVEFPGQHDVSFSMPQEFANTTENTIERWRRERVMGKKLWTINRWLAEYLCHYKYTSTAFSRAKNIGCYIIELVPERLQGFYI
jgi:hypothetical protein